MPNEELRNDEDVDEILRLAISRSTIGGTQSLRDRLNRSALELGLSPEEVQKAELEYFEKQREAQELAEFKSSQRRSFLSSLGTYILVNGCFVAFNLIVGHSLGWSVWPLGIWGLILLSHFPGEMMPRSHAFKEEFQRWKKKKAKKHGKNSE